ncbi:4-amino-4-deoxychorismate lyase [Citricoccus zhacaiensis]|uniref:4-amino-4-deoxychorismate lyase n=1 Tax=Citricoccus zhacaiensis TaxID=489142 RepID=A0ABQ2M6N0_9MICC|nr:aminotransferase class IV [Citricoccus zhacaiensis]GGO47704.1 4-amino-4-deoxychorismate lyase [Citricoccus zhacaiensis]
MTESSQPAAPFVPGPGESVVVYLEPDAGPASSASSPGSADGPADGPGVSLRVDDPRRPAILVTDQGLTRGDGVFETMTAVATEGSGSGSGTGAPFRVRKEDSHLARLATSAEALEIPLPPAPAWRQAAAAGLDAFAAGNPGVDAVVKLVATRGPEGAPGGGHYVRGAADVGSDGELAEATEPGLLAPPHLTGTYWVLVSPVSRGLAAARERGLKVLLLDRGVDSGVAERAPWLLMGTKSLSYAVNMAALRYAASQGADDVIFTSSDGQVLEGPTSTVLMARRIPQQDGSTGIELITPLRSSGILPGTSQGTIFAAAQAAGWQLGYGPLEPSDLVDADGVWLVSSVRLVAPVTHLDGEEILQDPELTELLNGFLAEDREPGEHGP